MSGGGGLGSDQLINEIKKLRTNAVYGKKRHFNASDRKRRKHHFLTYSVLVLNIVTGSVLFGVMKDQLWEHLPALMALSSALLIGTEEYFKFGKHSSEHHAIGSRYLALARDCSGLVALNGAGHISEEDLKTRFLQLQKALTEIDTSANAYPTNRQDYDESRKGVQDGEERYTAKELEDTE